MKQHPDPAGDPHREIHSGRLQTLLSPCFYFLNDSFHQTVSDHLTSSALEISCGEKSAKETELSKVFLNH